MSRTRQPGADTPRCSPAMSGDAVLVDKTEAKKCPNNGDPRS